MTWDERPLFGNRFEAWPQGPICPDLYEKHEGMFKVKPTDIDGDPARLDDDARETIKVMLDTYGNFTTYQLTQFTHREAPWRDARDGLEQDAPCTREITWAAMAEYYGGLTE